MNKIFISFVCFAILLAGCENRKEEHSHGEHGHSHGTTGHSELEPLAYTIYTDKFELFVEFNLWWLARFLALRHILHN
ncbi:MAG: hypothetical protein JKY42_02510 [Flavobacteriales bacterium]|nr:hypothetical protein [Flavobacteriales bacterium]